MVRFANKLCSSIVLGKPVESAYLLFLGHFKTQRNGILLEADIFRQYLMDQNLQDLTKFV